MQASSKFSKFIEKETYFLTVRKPLYVAVSQTVCGCCGKTTPVACLASNNFSYFDYSSNENDDNLYWIKSNEFSFFSSVKNISRELWNILRIKFPYYSVYFQKDCGGRVWANNCTHCKNIFEDFQLHSIKGEAFWPYNEKSCEEIILVEIPVKNEIEISACFEWSSYDEIIMERANKYELIEVLV